MCRLCREEALALYIWLAYDWRKAEPSLETSGRSPTAAKCLPHDRHVSTVLLKNDVKKECKIVVSFGAIYWIPFILSIFKQTLEYEL